MKEKDPPKKQNYRRIRKSKEGRRVREVVEKMEEEKEPISRRKI
jgi:hypothetical protein